MRFKHVKVGQVFRAAEPWLVPTHLLGTWIRIKTKTRKVKNIGPVIIANAKRVKDPYDTSLFDLDTPVKLVKEQE